MGSFRREKAYCQLTWAGFGDSWTKEELWMLLDEAKFSLKRAFSSFSDESYCSIEIFRLSLAGWTEYSKKSHTNYAQSSCVIIIIIIIIIVIVVFARVSSLLLGLVSWSNQHFLDSRHKWAWLSWKCEIILSRFASLACQSIKCLESYFGLKILSNVEGVRESTFEQQFRLKADERCRNDR